jgi:hypothetical protein
VSYSTHPKLKSPTYRVISIGEGIFLISASINISFAKPGGSVKVKNNSAIWC